MVLSGEGRVIVENMTDAKVGQLICIPCNNIHRITNPTDSELVIAEMGWGRVDENDIIRHDDIW